ncbi:MAG: phosphoenolpyruvate carboxylase [Polyangiaceae bacterium]|nr:phosphoenolpyruvate carboxylase [Polyangiaceae bacterium]
MAQDSDRELRDDVRYVGDRLGDTLRASAGPWLYELVEEVRRLAKGARAGNAEAASALRDLLGKLDTDRAHPLARAFAHFLALANVAESRHRARSHGSSVALLTESLNRIRAAGATSDAIFEAACRQPIELVLTAHPTQASRRTALSKYERIARALARREHGDASVDEEIRREIASIWHTDDLRRLRPTPVDEARTELALFERVLWDAVPAFLRDWDTALHAVTGRRMPWDLAPIRFGSWMGGDRDGNPNVTPEITRRVCLMMRWQAADLYGRELAKLHDELSIGTATDEVRELAGRAHEPYRKLIRDLENRVADTRKACEDALTDDGRRLDPAALLTTDELVTTLGAMMRSLSSVGLEIVARGRLTDLLRRASAFGVTLAPLDIRQHADVHTAALDAVTRALDLGSYGSWKEEERTRFLLAELESKRPLFPRELPNDPALTDVITTLRLCAGQPRGSLGAYVISGTRAVSDVLAVYLFQREAGLSPPLRVVPLFETLADLQAAPAITGRLLDQEAFRRRVGDSVEVMIGYSDSGKDAGRVASAFALFEAQEQLVEVARRHEVALTLFHGRGGTIGRGGGPIALSIRSQPAGSVANGLRVTVQGESIDAAFGLPEIARQTFELYVTSTLESSLCPPPAPRPEHRAMMREMAARSAKSYRAVLEDPRFYPYFQASTPERELGLLNIGSRPAKRSPKGGLGSLRAIPWHFAWTQNRLLLPSWLGAHEALEPREPKDEKLLREMLEEWPFFAALVDLLEMVLGKGDLPTASHYDDVLVPADLKPMGRMLMSMFRRTETALSTLRGHRVLLEENPVLRFSIDVRNPYLYPLSLLQVELLRRLRADGAAPHDERVADALLVTVHGIAAGMRNTG